MFNRPLLLSLSTFFILMIFISLIKNNTRNIEKNIKQLNTEISILKKDLLNAEIDFIYLSNPENLIQHLEISREHYTNFDHSRVFFSINHFMSQDSKETKFYKESNLK